MIQRIQSVYLLAQIVILSILFFVPFAEFITTDSQSIIFTHNAIANADTTLLSTLPVTVLLIIMIGLSLVSIFLFKKRTLQIRFCVYNTVLSIGILILLAYYIHQITSSELEILSSSYKVWMAIPIASLFCSVQALRGIRKDEVLVNSSRLR